MAKPWDNEVIIRPPEPRYEPRYWDETPRKNHYSDIDESISTLIRFENSRFPSQNHAEAWVKGKYGGRILETLHTARYWCWRVQ